MDPKETKPLHSGFKYLYSMLNKNLLKNIIFLTGGILIFIAGIVIYGILLNLREVPLDEAMLEKGYRELKNVSLIIDRKSYTMSLYEDSVLIKSYRVCFGRNLNYPKMRNNDGATPVGSYIICSIENTHKYHKFFVLNYPNFDDISFALRRGIISQEKYDSLAFSINHNVCPDENSVLGGRIGIHGIGKYNSIFKNLPFVFNWTDGSIATSNESLDELFSVIKTGTKVIIK